MDELRSLKLKTIALEMMLKSLWANILFSGAENHALERVRIARDQVLQSEDALVASGQDPEDIQTFIHYLETFWQSVETEVEALMRGYD